MPSPRIGGLRPLQCIVRPPRPAVNELAPPGHLINASDKRHPLNALSRRVLERYAAQPLRWHVQVSLSVSHSACVRTWARRRIQAAFKQALERQGYDQHGRRVNGTGTDLQGCVKLILDQQVVTGSWDEVRQRAEAALQTVMRPREKRPRVAKST